MTASDAPYRSRCPINVALELVGDQWSLLVIRDIMLKGKRHFADFLDSEEKIASNILSDRLARLTANGIVQQERSPDDRRRFVYSLTERGKALAPVLYELILWAAEVAPTAAPEAELRQMRADRDGYLLAMAGKA